MRHAQRGRGDSLSPSRSRSPRAQAILPPSLEVREAFLADFAALFWLRNRSPEDPPWGGEREARIRQFRERLVSLAELAAPENEDWIDDLLARPHRGTIEKVLLSRWQRFTFFDDLARMSDVLFQGPIDGRHAHEVDVRLLRAWQRLESAGLAFAAGPVHLSPKLRDYHISAVRVAVMLETERPPEEEESLPDARTLATLLNLRCEKEGEEEVLEMYKVLCHKLANCRCPWCSDSFDEGSSLGHFDTSTSTHLPSSVPKLLVPQCGHAMHTLCFGSQLTSDQAPAYRGCCRLCQLEYAWTSADVDPLLDTFGLVFGPYIDQRATEMSKAREWPECTLQSFVEACVAFSAEINGLLSPVTAWRLLMRRHRFSAEDAMVVVNEAVLARLTPSEDDGPHLQPDSISLFGPGVSVVDAEEDSETECGISDLGSLPPTPRQAKRDRAKVTNIFLADPSLEPDLEQSPSNEGDAPAGLEDSETSDGADDWDGALPPPPLPLVEDI